MVRHLTQIVEALAVVGTVAAIAYHCLCLWSALRFLRDRKAVGGRVRSIQQPAPPVTILKPLRGTDPEMYESFRCHCLQDYPEYEIVFGVSDADDPAIESVRALKR